MESEKYQPSGEEVRKAEGHLTPMQEKATENRERVFSANERTTKVPGALMKMRGLGKLKEGPFEETFEGEINGHKVTLTAQGHSSRNKFAGQTFESYQLNYAKFSAVVDGIEMSPDDSKKISNKFAWRYMVQSATEEDMKRIEEEQRAFQLQEIRKDLGI
jgi:hypothetical protein